jgi:uncharacterized alpha-E superfamily protein
MLSRIADALFWLNRYMERIHGILLLSSTHYTLLLDKDIHVNITWAPLLELYTNRPPEEIEVLKDDTGAVMKKMISDLKNPNSLVSLVHKARENARGVQDHITKEVWEEVNSFFHDVNDPSVNQKLAAYEVLSVMDTFMNHTVSYAGLIDTTMFRGIGWNFMNLGKYLERCLQTIAVTEHQLRFISVEEEDNDIFQWRYLLLSLSGYEMHLKSYHTLNANYNVLHQVVQNENFPHSILYSLNHILVYLKRVVTRNDEEGTALLRSFNRLQSRVEFMDLALLNPKDIAPLLAEIKQELHNFSRMLVQYFFSYS